LLLIGGLTAALVEPPHANPASDPARHIDRLLSPPPAVANLIRRSCMDCHSNDTQWPWYSRVQPVAKLMTDDVVRGRAVLNFSEWRNGREGAGLLLAACAALETRKMPREPYRTMHPGSAPSKEEIRAFCEWSQQTAKRLFAASREH
jgi:hypothetical protein